MFRREKFPSVCLEAENVDFTHIPPIRFRVSISSFKTCENDWRRKMSFLLARQVSQVMLG